MFKTFENNHKIIKDKKKKIESRKNHIKNKMLILDTYVNSITQEIINSKYLSSFNGGKYSLKRRSYRKKKNTSKVFCFNKFRNKK